MKIPLYRPYVNEEMVRAVTAVLCSRKLSRGESVIQFESEFATYVGKKHAVALNSGTSALMVAVGVLGWKEGDEIITTPYSFIASSNCLLVHGVKPVFVDIDPTTLNIDPSKIEEKIGPRTKGILIVDIFGLSIDVDCLRDIAKRHDLLVLEDACEALGRHSEIFAAGKIGDIVAYGFHENKQLTTGGEGGMLVTDDDQLAEKSRAMRDQGRSNHANWIENVTLGFNFRMTEMQAAFGSAQLHVLDEMLARRKKIADQYSLLFSKVDGVATPAQITGSERSWFIYFVLLENTEMRKAVRDALTQSGIGSSENYFPPIYRFPMYSDYKENCPAADFISDRLLALPLFYEMTDEEVNVVVAEVVSAIQNYLNEK
jgi:perosamine synthetase